MKSLMEEGSSISKAIESAWTRAGKPSQFSVKILEEPERNMFGLIRKSAKIALFFEEKQRHEQPSYSERPREPRRPQKQASFSPQPERRSEPQRTEKKKRPTWTPQLSKEASNWISQTLSLIGLPHVKFEAKPAGNLLKFSFDTSLTGTEAKDRMLFSSFACLIMTTLRQRHKRTLRNLKVVLTTV